MSRRFGPPAVLGRSRMQKIDKLAHAAKVIALSLPPVLVAVTGLVMLSRRKGATKGTTAAGLIRHRPTAANTGRLGPGA
jgi:hypothetical protein